MARSKSAGKYHYSKTRHEDTVQHIGIRSTNLFLETVEVIVFDDGRVRIQESTYHIPSERLTSSPAIELTGEEAAEEAQYRINEMRYYKAH